MKNLAAIVIAVFIITACKPHLPRSAPPEILSSALASAFETELGEKAYSGVITGIAVSDASSGKAVFLRNADKPLVTASVTKMVTAAAALEELGADRRFVTPVTTDGAQAGGVLKGNIYLAGRGDPSLTLKDLAATAEILRKKGIREIDGDIVYDTSWFDEEKSRYGRNARNLYAPACSLTVNYNWIDVIIRDGPPVVLELAPRTSYAKLSSEVTLSSSSAPGRPGLTLKEFPWGDDFSIVGTISKWDRRYHYVWFGVSRPGLFFATLFKEACEKEGILVRSAIRPGKAPANAAVLCGIKGAKVGAMVQVMNRESNNIIAETLGKVLGAELVSQPGTRAKGIKAMTDFLAGIESMREGSFSLADASGLSAANRFSANQLTGLLNRIRRDPGIRDAFTESLAEQGHHPHAMNPVPPEGIRVFVKTGTLSVQGVNSVAGYVIAEKSGLVLSFAILANREKPGPMTYSGTLTNPLLKVLIDTVNRSIIK